MRFALSQTGDRRDSDLKLKALNLALTGFVKLTMMRHVVAARESNYLNFARPSALVRATGLRQPTNPALIGRPWP
jgi:hypothetical protein